jgi:hypothetical protein
VSADRQASVAFRFGGWRTPLRQSFVAIALESRPVAIHLGGVADDVGVAQVKISFLVVHTGAPGPRRPIMPLAFVVVIVGGLVVLYVETLVLVGIHTASFHWS